MSIKDSNTTIMVKDMDISISFYQSIGFILKQRWDNHYAQLTAPGIVIGLHPASDNIPQEGSGNISIGFTIEDFQEAKSFLETLSIHAISRDEEGGQFLHFNDPDSTALYFIKTKW